MAAERSYARDVSELRRAEAEMSSINLSWRACRLAPMKSTRLIVWPFTWRMGERAGERLDAGRTLGRTD